MTTTTMTCPRSCPLLFPRILERLGNFTADYPPHLLEARRVAFVAKIENDGSDTSLAAQLDEAGFGSAGIM